MELLLERMIEAAAKGGGKSPCPRRVRDIASGIHDS
jgi:hypothetical protein